LLDKKRGERKEINNKEIDQRSSENERTKKSTKETEKEIEDEEY
jgi:hypothetical protein